MYIRIYIYIYENTYTNQLHIHRGVGSFFPQAMTVGWDSVVVNISYHIHVLV